MEHYDGIIKLDDGTTMPILACIASNNFIKATERICESYHIQLIVVIVPGCNLIKYTSDNRTQVVVITSM